MTLLNNPFLLGFEGLEDLLTTAKGAEGFPPYNIEQTSPERLQITLAVAGYGESDLDVAVEDNQLMIRGRQNSDQEHHYLHRGIAARSFIRTFVLADGMKVEGARLENGLLTIDLIRPVRQPHVQRIAIRTNEQPVLIHPRRRKK